MFTEATFVAELEYVIAPELKDVAVCVKLAAPNVFETAELVNARFEAVQEEYVTSIAVILNCVLIVLPLRIFRLVEAVIPEIV